MSCQELLLLWGQYGVDGFGAPAFLKNRICHGRGARVATLGLRDPSAAPADFMFASPIMRREYRRFMTDAKEQIRDAETASVF